MPLNERKKVSVDSKANVNAQESKITQLETGKDKVQDNLDSANIILADAKAARDKAQNAFDDAQAKFDKLKAKFGINATIPELRNKKAQAEKDLIDAKATLVKVKAELKIKEDKLMSTNDKLKQIDADKNKLEDKLNQDTKDLQKINQQNQFFEMLRDSQRANETRVKTTIRTIEDALVVNQKQKDELTKQIAELTKQIAAMQKDVNSNDIYSV